MQSSIWDDLEFNNFCRITVAFELILEEGVRTVVKTVALKLTVEKVSVMGRVSIDAGFRVCSGDGA